MEKLRRLIAWVRAWLAAQHEREQRSAAVPHEIRYRDQIAAWKVVRDVLLVR